MVKTYYFLIRFIIHTMSTTTVTRRSVVIIIRMTISAVWPPAGWCSEYFDESGLAAYKQTYMELFSSKLS